ncbi:MAG: sulfotransferase domain-containing protein [Candidatus Lokiarchaeota archaeon]|nr:sulfotransferase domain-containing protein [Candidatus Lokiarchaeota archaeon]
MGNIRDELIIVSGIPRSGTSLIMQMLRAGGMDILSDHKRKADKNNPKGYLELQAVKNLFKDNSCLVKQTGKVVKVISHLLIYIPKNQLYKIIFINRNINEIIKSQQKMLRENTKNYSKTLKKAFKKELSNVKLWINNQPNIELLNLNFKDIIKNPEKEINNIIKFLNISLNREKMINIIEPSLYRNEIMKKAKSHNSE